jgi:transcriptional regulator with XRE-family HTH domain
MVQTPNARQKKEQVEQPNNDRDVAVFVSDAADDHSPADAPTTIAPIVEGDAETAFVDAAAGIGVERVRIPYDVIGATIKALRQRKRWRQVDLASKAGVAEGTITGVELGRRTQIPNVKKIAAALGVDFQTLTSGDAVDRTSLDDLTDEDLMIARLYNQAATPIKITIRRLLRTENIDIAERFDRLDEDRQRRVRLIIDAELEQQLVRVTKTATKNVR